MVNKKITVGIIIILVVVITLLAIFLPKGSSGGFFGLGGSSKDNLTSTKEDTLSTQKNVTTFQITSNTQTNDSTSLVEVTQNTSQTNTYSTDGIVTEDYEKGYERYDNCGYVPPGYHRYQSNLCDPTQDELPITMPNPNEGLDPVNIDPLWSSIQYGSLPCGKSNKLNYCQ